MSVGEVYISYSQSDAAAAKKIRDALQGWGHKVWFDDPDDEFDQGIAEQFDRALRECQVFIALLSPPAVKSRTVRREIALAKSHGKAIIPVIVQPLPNVEEGGKYIDATTNLNEALPRLIKVVDARVAAVKATPARPPERPPVPAAAPSAPARRFNLLVVLGILAGVVILVSAIIIALDKSNEASRVRTTAEAFQRTALAAAQQPTIPPPTASATTDSNSIALTATALNNLLSPTVATPDATATLAAVLTKAAPGTQSAQTATSQARFAATTTLAAVLTKSAPNTQAAQTATTIAKSATPMVEVAEEASPTPEEILLQPTATPIQVATPPPGDLSNVTNILTNPGFESLVPFNGNPPGQVAQGWTAWAITQGATVPSYQLQPEYGQVAPNEGRIRNGINAQQYTSEFSTHNAGVYQQVSGIAPGANVRFSVYAYVWSTGGADPSLSEDPGDVSVQVGIGPTGGTDPQSASIIWSAPAVNYDAYQEYAVTATVTNSTVTVFIRSTVDVPVQTTTVYLDDALLFVMSG